MYKFLTFFTLFLLVSFHANAAPPKEIGEFGDWIAYHYKETNGDVCYMASAPKKDEGKYNKRGDIYVVVTHRPKEKSFDVVNFVAGYDYKTGSEVAVKIGNKTIDNLFTSGDKAWAISDSTDKELVAAMQKGDKMIVHGESSRGTKTKDTYSLKGFSAAYKAISTKCNKK
ncbi:MAG: invasion associated locus B family protein [Lactobacillus sp.]|jgi:invasion protein IalB|nr:invasion associated locus B family protein [Lactobacillus sp.]